MDIKTTEEEIIYLRSVKDTLKTGLISRDIVEGLESNIPGILNKIDLSVEEFSTTPVKSFVNPVLKLINDEIEEREYRLYTSIKDMEESLKNQYALCGSLINRIYFNLRTKGGAITVEEEVDYRLLKNISVMVAKDDQDYITRTPLRKYLSDLKELYLEPSDVLNIVALISYNTPEKSALFPHDAGYDKLQVGEPVIGDFINFLSQINTRNVYILEAIRQYYLEEPTAESIYNKITTLITISKMLKSLCLLHF